MFLVMGVKFCVTLELKNIRMEDLLFIFWGNIDTLRYSATEFGRNRPVNFHHSGTLINILGYLVYVHRKAVERD